MTRIINCTYVKVVQLKMLLPCKILVVYVNRLHEGKLIAVDWHIRAFLLWDSSSGKPEKCLMVCLQLCVIAIFTESNSLLLFFQSKWAFVCLFLSVCLIDKNLYKQHNFLFQRPNLCFYFVSLSSHSMFSFIIVAGTSVYNAM